MDRFHRGGSLAYILNHNVNIDVYMDIGVRCAVLGSEIFRSYAVVTSRYFLVSMIAANKNLS